MTKAKITEIAEWADTHDFSAEIENAEPVEEPVDPDPMISTSLRLPKSLLDWVRERADEQHIKPTTYIRQLLEHTRSGENVPSNTENRLERLEQAVFSS